MERRHSEKSPSSFLPTKQLVDTDRTCYFEHYWINKLLSSTLSAIFITEEHTKPSGLCSRTHTILSYSSAEAQGFQWNLLPNLISVFKTEGDRYCREVTNIQYSLAREISHMDESVIEGSKDMADAEHVFSFSNLRSQADDLFFLLLLALTRCHF